MRRENRVNSITLGAQASTENGLQPLGVQVIRHEDLQRYQRMFAEAIYMSTVPFQFLISDGTRRAGKVPG